MKTIVYKINQSPSDNIRTVEPVTLKYVELELLDNKYCLFFAPTTNESIANTTEVLESHIRIHIDDEKRMLFIPQKLMKLFVDLFGKFGRSAPKSHKFSPDHLSGNLNTTTRFFSSTLSDYMLTH